MFPFELELQRHLEQPARARVARVEAMPEAGRDLVLARALIDDLLSRLLHRPAVPHQGEPAVEEAHARFDVAAVVRPEREDARRDAILQRRARDGHVARGERGRRRHAVIDR